MNSLDISYYFAYGSNMSSGRLSKRLKEKSSIQEKYIQKIIDSRQLGILNGYNLIFNKKAYDGDYSYANIEKNQDCVVEGILYNYESDKFISCLDKEEGYPYHYKREIIEVTKSNGEILKAIIYIANEEYIRENLIPKKEYIEHLLSAEDLLSKDYVQKLRKILEESKS
jgi:cation transport regulator ChaC